MDNDKHLIRYAKGRGANLGKAKNETNSWGNFSAMLSKPVVTSERQREFAKMTDKEQATLKGVNGWIFRAPIEGNVRNRSSSLPGDMITLDFDYLTPEFLEELLAGKICPEWEWVFHTSRRHTPEKPRGRLFLLLKTAIQPDLYGAASRIIAQRFDPTMTHVDKVSFRVAQMMYLPTASKDGEFIHHRNRGEACDWSAVLDEFELLVGDWHDLKVLPTVPNEHLRETSEKAEDPTTKQGPVGDFCRAYDVPAAIEKFLPDKYEPSDVNSAKPRYTYLGGTTTNGAEVQDDGLFLYSHHGSDPCGDMLVNAFDLVRIHLYGVLDEKEDNETPIAKRPSWKRMIEFIQTDPEFRKAQVASRYDINAMTEDFDMAMEGVEVETDEDYDQEIEDLVGKPVKRDKFGAPVSEAKAGALKRRPRPEKDWITKLETTLQGTLISNSANITQIVNHDLRTRDSVAYNKLHDRLVLREPLRTKLPYLISEPVADPLGGLMMEDRHINQIRILLESAAGTGLPGYGLRTVTERDLQAAVEQVGWQNAYHPVVEYLEAQGRIWDGVERAERLFIEYLGCPDTAYFRQAARLFLIAAVARAFEPGHKFDFVPILCGAQGQRKSSFIKVLAKSWFGELKVDFKDEKKAVEQMLGFWIMELPELSSLSRSQVEDIKAFVSSVGTSLRMAYGRLPKAFKRQCVMMGSTNDETYLLDTTGNRRWWPLPVKVDKIDTDKLAQNIDQIWGEVHGWYVAMRQAQPYGDLPLYLTDADAIRQSEELQAEAQVYNESDTYAEQISGYLNSHINEDGWDDFDEAMGNPKRVRRRYVTIGQVWIEALEQSVKHTRTDANAVGRALKANGWLPNAKPVRIGGVLAKVYRPSTDVVRRWKEEDARASRES